MRLKKFEEGDGLIGDLKDPVDSMDEIPEAGLTPASRRGWPGRTSGNPGADQRQPAAEEGRGETVVTGGIGAGATLGGLEG